MRTWVFAAVLGSLAPMNGAGGATSAESAPADESATAVCGGLWISGGELHDAATGALVWSEATDTVTSLGCQGGGATMAAVGATRGARGDGRIVLLQPGAAPGAPWSVLGEIALRGVPRRLALESGRLAVVVEGRREASFGIVDAAPGIKIQTVKMAETPVGLGVSPDGESFVLAAGSALRTYRVDDGRTRTIIPFEEPIVALASQRGVGRMLVALGSRIVAVDPRDKPERGSLPVRAQADLPGPAKSLVWMDGGRAAGALIAQPAALLLLGGNDLAVLERDDREADAIGPAGISELRWVRGGKEKATGVVRLAAAPPELAAYEPAPPPTIDSDVDVVETPTPAPAKGQAVEPSGKAGAPAAKAEPAKPTPPPVPAVPPPPLKAEPSSPAPARVEAPPPAKEEQSPAVKSEPPPAPKTEPAPVKAEPAPVPKTEPAPAKTEPPPAPKPEPAPAKTEPPPAPKTEPAPAKTEPPPPGSSPQKAASPPATTEPLKGEPPANTDASSTATRPPSSPPENVPTPSTPPQGAPPTSPPHAPAVAPSAPPLLPPAAPKPGNEAPGGGSITGSFSGKPELVEEVIVLGPDSLLKQFARVKVTRSQGSATFTLDNVPPGHYVVTPMGAHGASLSARPAAARLVVTPDAGGRVDFEILGAL